MGTTCPETKRAPLVACAIALATIIAAFAFSAQAPVAALGKVHLHKTNTINYNKGIGGVNIGSTRGQVSRILGAPQSKTKFTEPGVNGDIYEADYTDDKLSVFYKNTTGKKRFDPVLGVATGSSRYTNTPAVGQDYFPGADCLSLDSGGVAPDGGPPTVSSCSYRKTPVWSIFIMSGGASRATEFILKVFIWNRLSGLAIWNALEQGAMDDIQCFPPDCDVHVA